MHKLITVLIFVFLIPDNIYFLDTVTNVAVYKGIKQICSNSNKKRKRKKYKVGNSYNTYHPWVGSMFDPHP